MEFRKQSDAPAQFVKHGNSECREFEVDGPSSNASHRISFDLRKFIKEGGSKFHFNRTLTGRRQKNDMVQTAFLYMGYNPTNIA